MHRHRLKLARLLWAGVVAAITAATTVGMAVASSVGRRAVPAHQTSGVGQQRRTVPARWIIGDWRLEPAEIPAPADVGRAFRLENGHSGTATSVVVFVGAGTTAQGISVALYTSSRAHPVIRLAAGRRRSLRRARWNVVAITPVFVRAGHAYWLAILPSSGRLELRGRVGRCGGAWSKGHLTSLPARWTRGQEKYECRVSAYVEGSPPLQSVPGAGAGTGTSSGTGTGTGTPLTFAGPVVPTGGSGSGSGSGVGLLTTGCSPGADATMTNTISHLCGFADTTNAGVPAGTILYPASLGPSANTGSGWTYSGGVITTTTVGAVIKNVSCSSCHVDVVNADVTIEDSDLSESGTDAYIIELMHASGATIANNNVHGVGISVPNGCDSAVRDMNADSDDLTVENNNVWYCSNPMNNIADGGLIEQNYFHDLGAPTSGNHYEDIQFEPGNGALMTVQDNTFFNQNSQTASIILSNDGGGTETNRVINHNLLAGGGYTFYGAGGSSTPSTNITFTNNSFSPMYYTDSGYWGPVAYWTSGNGNVWSGNIWDNNGSPTAP